MANRGHGLLVAGLRQAPEVHALLHVLNAALGNVGKTVSYLPIDDAADPVHRRTGRRAERGPRRDPGRSWTATRSTPRRRTWSSPRPWPRPRHRIHLGHRDDATGRQCTWHLPLAHYLESWGDAMGWDLSHLRGAAVDRAPVRRQDRRPSCCRCWSDDDTAQQLRRSRATVSTAMTGGAGAAPDDDPGFEKTWRAFIHDGFRQGSGQANGAALALAGAPSERRRRRRRRCRRTTWRSASSRTSRSTTAASPTTPGCRKCPTS